MAKQHGHGLPPATEPPRVPFSLPGGDDAGERRARNQLQHLAENARYCHEGVRSCLVECVLAEPHSPYQPAAPEYQPIVLLAWSGCQGVMLIAGER